MAMPNDANADVNWISIKNCPLPCRWGLWDKYSNSQACTKKQLDQGLQCLFFSQHIKDVKKELFKFHYKYMYGYLEF